MCADFPSSDPYVMAAGGTHLRLNSDNSIDSESAWCGAGGADSVFFAEPSYKTSSAGWVSNSSCAADADFRLHDGWLYCCWYRQPPEFGYVHGCGSGHRLFHLLQRPLGQCSAAPASWPRNWPACSPSPGSRTATGLAQRLAGSCLMFCVANGSELATDFNDITRVATACSAPQTGWDHPTGWGTPDASAIPSSIILVALLEPLILCGAVAAQGPPILCPPGYIRGFPFTGPLAKPDYP